MTLADRTYADAAPVAVVHDADSHVMETPDWFHPFADPDVRDRLEPAYVMPAGWRTDSDPEPDDATQVMLRKNWRATGALHKEDRPHALDLMGFASQLVFNTFANKRLQAVEHQPDLDLTYGLARAHNRAMADFCSVDRRLLAVGYVPLADFDRAAAMAREALELGCKALMVASACPPGHSPSHVALDPVWATAQEAGVPVVLHVGGGGQLLDPSYFVNGLPAVPDFHGGAENFRSVDYLAIPYPPMQTVATMIVDGVLDRFPDLRIGIIEQGASWLPGWMRNMDSAHRAFAKNEERLQRLSLLPSEFVRRQVRVTPYPHEDTGWIIANSGDEVCMFSSDYPHVEGGRNPLARFGASTEDLSPEALQRFYCDNFVDLMGRALDQLDQ
jgi:predicted TIM-barrel fold metal-dependent hydrolase